MDLLAIFFVIVFFAAMFAITWVALTEKPALEEVEDDAGRLAQ